MPTADELLDQRNRPAGVAHTFSADAVKYFHGTHECCAGGSNTFTLEEAYVKTSLEVNCNFAAFPELSQPLTIS